MPQNLPELVQEQASMFGDAFKHDDDTSDP